MRYFAKKILYAASGTHSFVALIELYEEGASEPFCFVLYRYFEGDKFMELFKFREEAKEKFPYGRAGFWGNYSEHQTRTSDWLYDVSVGGSYQRHEENTLVLVEPMEELPAEFR